MNTFFQLFTIILCGLVFGGCTAPDFPDFEYDILGDADEEADPLCSQDFALCGDVLIPHPFEQGTELIAIGLYRSLPPMGPPYSVVIREEAPKIEAGGRFKLRMHPVLEEGELYLWVSLLTEGSVSVLPRRWDDFTGFTPEPLSFDGGPVVFEDIRLVPFEGY